MSLHALWERSMRTGVVSRRIGKGASSAARRGLHAAAAQAGCGAAGRPGGRCGTSTGCRVPAYTAPHLVGQSLEAQAMVSFGQRTGNGFVGPLHRLRLQEDVDGFLEPAAQQVVVAVKRDESAVGNAGFVGQVETMNSIQEEQRAHALVQVAAGAPEGVQLGALGQQAIQRRRPAERVH